MSSVIFCNICSGARPHQELYNIADLKRSSEAGCQPCSIIYHALESFHGSWFKDHGENIKIRRFLSFGCTLRIDVFRDEAPRKTIFAEVVYEERSSRLESPATVSQNSKKLEGPYSSLGILPGRKVPSLPEQGIDLMRNWIQQCIVNHPRCQTDSHPPLPKRVIDVGISPGAVVRLYESNGERASYTSLSHRWGSSVLITTTSSTLHSRKRAIEWSSLSKTFQDAVTLTRLLGLRYLWIDSLCIVQDDSIDWQIESSKMAGIYEKSYVTISANSSSGILFGPSAMRKCNSVQMGALNPEGEPYTLIIRSPLDHQMFFAGSLEGVGVKLPPDHPLSKRAWCFQERLLATRILHFTEDEVVFECKTHCECECGSMVFNRHGTPLKKLYSGTIQRDFTAAPTIKTPWDGWQAIVTPYMRKDITNPLDILPALAGIASRVQCDELGPYVAGLWKNRLNVGLFWFASIVSIREPPVISAPTFSWASLAGTSKVHDMQWSMSFPDDKVSQLYEILEVHCPPAGLNPYGTVSDSFVKLRGLVTAITLKHEEGVLPFGSVVCSKACEQRASAYLDKILITEMTAERHFVCFFGFISSSSWKNPPADKERLSALIVEPVGIDIYQRVGCLPFLDFDPAWWIEAVEKDITIV